MSISGITTGVPAEVTRAERRRDAWIAAGEGRAVERLGIYFIAREPGGDGAREVARHTFLAGLVDLLGVQE